MVTYRKYEYSDSEAIRTLENDRLDIKCSLVMALSALKESYDDKYIRSFVAEVDNKIVGFIYGFCLPNGLLIPEYLCVHPDYRNKSIGRGLLNTLYEASGCRTVQVYHHKDLHSFYEKCGYDYGDNLEVAIKDISK